MRLEQQTKALEQKMEAQVSAVMELQEYFKKRSEIEQDYSQKLDRLAKTFQAKQKPERQRWLRMSY